MALHMRLLGAAECTGAARDTLSSLHGGRRYVHAGSPDTQHQLGLLQSPGAPENAAVSGLSTERQTVIL